MSTNDDSRSLPKSMRHKQVLDVAEDNPDASIKELASQVPSATVELVERVLEKHGDPASDDVPAESESGEATQDRGEEAADEPIAAGATEASDDQQATEDTGGSESVDPTTDTADDTAKTDTNESESAQIEGSTPDPDDESKLNAESYPAADQLSAKQREVLAVVAEQPRATQQAIGDQLGVSAATVSNRVNSIEGFDWSEREQFVDAVFDEQPTHSALTDGEIADSTSDDGSQTATSASASSSEPASSSESASSNGRSDRDGRLDTALSDPELLHKVVHACMRSDVISEDEELRIIRELLE